MFRASAEPTIASLDGPKPLQYASPGAAPSAAAEPPALTSFCARLVRHRIAFFLIVAALFITAFNGQWRIGRDSAAYRGIARNLVRSHQYVFRPKAQQIYRNEDKQDIVYPGVPLLLAGVQMIFGEGALPPLLLMYALALITLVLVYRLCALYFPPWVGVAVVCGLGVNRIFLEHSNELLSDLPFLLGVVLSLYGFEKLRRAGDVGQRIGALAMIVPGLGLSAVMRPTFWILALAWVAACVWGLIFGDRLAGTTTRSRAPYAIALATLLSLALLGVAMDPRTRGFDPLSGGYERRVTSQLGDFKALLAGVWRQHLPKTMEEHLPAAVFAMALKNKTIALRCVVWAYSLMVIGSGLWLFRISRLWGFLVLFSFATLIVLGDNPRYYLMIMPLLLGGWAMFCWEVARRMNWFPLLPALAMLWGLGIIGIPNFIRSLDLVREQRGLDHSLHYQSFANVYEDGNHAPIIRMARLIHDNARPDQRVLGPEPTILTYLSDRQVHGLGPILPRLRRGWQAHVQSLGLSFAIFGPGKAAETYDDRDGVIARLMDSGLMRPGREVAHTAEGERLCELVLPAPRRFHARRQHRWRTTRPVAPTQSATIPSSSPKGSAP